MHVYFNPKTLKLAKSNGIIVVAKTGSDMSNCLKKLEQSLRLMMIYSYSMQDALGASKDQYPSHDMVDFNHKLWKKLQDISAIDAGISGSSLSDRECMEILCMKPDAGKHPNILDNCTAQIKQQIKALYVKLSDEDKKEIRETLLKTLNITFNNEEKTSQSSQLSAHPQAISPSNIIDRKNSNNEQLFQKFHL